MTTGLSRLALPALLLAAAACPAAAQTIESDSLDALVQPGAREYDAPRTPPRLPPRGAPFGSRFGAASADLPATVPQPPGYGYGVPYGGYGYGAPPEPGYGYTSGPGYGEGYDGASGYGGRALVAPFGGGPGGQTPIPLGAGSLYSGSAVNGTAVGPQFSNQLPAYQARQRR